MKKRKTKTTILPSHRQAEIEVVEIENPNWNRAYDGDKTNPRKVMAIRNTKESAIGIMASRGLLSPDQVRAADKFRSLFETVGGSGAGSFDYSREPVDGGGGRDPISERQMVAGLELKRCEGHVGKPIYRILVKVAGEGRALSEIAANHRERLTFGSYVKDGLQELSEFWGFKTVDFSKRRA